MQNFRVLGSKDADRAIPIVLSTKWVPPIGITPFKLLPLQKASLCFECEQCRLGDIFPVIQRLIDAYEKLLSQC